MKRKKITGIVLFFSVLLICKSGVCDVAQENFKSFCAQEYKETQECPEDICQMQCWSETLDDDCQEICRPVKCTSLSPDECPLEFCSIMISCSGEKICHYQMAGERPECGDLAYAGQDVPCCRGLTRRCGVQFLDGNCDMVGKNSVYNLPICIPCGDGFCTNFEDNCNCPEDCNRKEYRGFDYDKYMEEQQRAEQEAFEEEESLKKSKAQPQRSSLKRTKTEDKEEGYTTNFSK